MKRLVVAIGRRPRTTLALMLTISLVALAGLPRVTFDSSLASLTVADDPARRFEMDPADQIRAMKTMRERGETMLAIYHSHPSAPPEPSVHDLDGLRQIEAHLN